MPHTLHRRRRAEKVFLRGAVGPRLADAVTICLHPKGSRDSGGENSGKAFVVAAAGGGNEEKMSAAQRINIRDSTAAALASQPSGNRCRFHVDDMPQGAQKTAKRDRRRLERLHRPRHRATAARDVNLVPVARMHAVPGDV